jgi:hypothetical protein
MLKNLLAGLATGATNMHPEPPKEPTTGKPSAGGSGGTFREGRADTKLIQKAIAARWPIPDKVRPEITARLCKIATSDTHSPRETTNAAKALFECDRINVDIERLDVQERTLQELLKLRLEKEGHDTSAPV